VLEGDKTPRAINTKLEQAKETFIMVDAGFRLVWIVAV